LWISHQYPICIPLRPHLCYIPCPSHPPWLDHSNYTWNRKAREQDRTGYKIYNFYLQLILENLLIPISI
jgi:hypothetical protein